MAEVAATPPATHKQPSRKGKRAWRKNVDLSEIQEGLKNVRDEIIRGGVIAEKEADELFVVDAAGDAEIEKQHKTKKLLKADEILSQRSAIPGVELRKRKASEQVVPTSSKRPRDGKYVSHKELQRLKRVADNEAGAVKLDDTGASHDPWAAAAAPPKHAELNFVPPQRPIREPSSLRQAPAPLTTTGKPVPSVRKPEAGKSYNPLVDDWSAILEREGDAEVQAERSRLAIEAAFAAKEARAAEEAAKVEAAERDEWATDYESEWDGIQSDAEQLYTVKPQRRKTPAERNKIKARKEREAKETWQRKQKERDAQEKRIQQIAKEMSTKDKAKIRTLLAIQNDDESSESDVEGEPHLLKRRHGKLSVPDAPLEVVLPDELQDSLRRLKPEGNLLTDRYRNLLINGKLEVRRRRGQHKQKRTDRTEKWSYKDWQLK